MSGFLDLLRQEEDPGGFLGGLPWASGAGQDVAAPSSQLQQAQPQDVDQGSPFGAASSAPDMIQPPSVSAEAPAEKQGLLSRFVKSAFGTDKSGASFRDRVLAAGIGAGGGDPGTYLQGIGERTKKEQERQRLLGGLKMKNEAFRYAYRPDPKTGKMKLNLGDYTQYLIDHGGAQGDIATDVKAMKDAFYEKPPDDYTVDNVRVSGATNQPLFTAPREDKVVPITQGGAAVVYNPNRRRFEDPSGRPVSADGRPLPDRQPPPDQSVGQAPLTGSELPPIPGQPQRPVTAGGGNQAGVTVYSPDAQVIASGVAPGFHPSTPAELAAMHMPPDTPGAQTGPNNEVHFQPAKPGATGRWTATAMKMQDERATGIQTASSINSVIDRMIAQLDSGQLELGPVKNLTQAGQNLVGRDTPQSKNYDSFRANVEAMRNAGLRLNKGVQTEGDAQRMINELIPHMTDKGVVRQRLMEIRDKNEQTVAANSDTISQMREDAGLPPIDPMKYVVKPLPLIAGTGGASVLKPPTAPVRGAPPAGGGRGVQPAGAPLPPEAVAQLRAHVGQNVIFDTPNGRQIWTMTKDGAPQFVGLTK